MEYQNLSLEQRLSENIKDYKVEHIFVVEQIKNYLDSLAVCTGAEYFLADRHGEYIAATVGFDKFRPDVVNEPGIKIRVANRTLAHLYVKTEELEEERKRATEQLFERTAQLFSALGQETYLHKELDSYSNVLEQKMEKEKYRVTHGDKEDLLTGTLNRTYFVNRRQIVDRSEVLPVAELCVNINDWKYVYDHYGNEESDRLIRVVAEFVKQNAKPEYIIGRTDGDVFTVLIPMAEEGEAEKYMSALQGACESFEDPRLAPSVACGIAVKYNVEQNLEDLYSDAEYEMFDNKYQIKNAPGYRERLEKGTK